jgi:CRP-like cAMP-binding protein
MSRVEELQKYALFGGLRQEQIEFALKFMEESWIEEGSSILKEGEPNDRIYFILEGCVAVTKCGKLLSEFSQGDSFGEMEVIDIMPTAATIHALTRTNVLTISNRNLHHIYKGDLLTFSMLIMNLARDLSRRLRHANEMVVQKPPESPANEWHG